MTPNSCSKAAGRPKRFAIALQLNRMLRLRRLLVQRRIVLYLTSRFPRNLKMDLPAWRLKFRMTITYGERKDPYLYVHMIAQALAGSTPRRDTSMKAGNNKIAIRAWPLTSPRPSRTPRDRASRNRRSAPA
jgi:hypothetical protein